MTEATKHLSNRSLALTFYFGWPAFLGILFGWVGVGALGTQLSRPISIAYWIVGFLVLRLTLELSIRLIALIAPKQKTPLAVLCVLSIPVYVFIGGVPSYVWQSLFIDFLPAGATAPPLNLFYESFNEYAITLSGSLVILIEWTLSNLIFDRVLGYPRLRNITGYSPKKRKHLNAYGSLQTPKDLAELNIVRRLPSDIGTDIIALSAEDHYVRVHTNLGNDLVLYRFSDAVSEMPESLGIRVHRSHWINTSAVTDFRKQGTLHRVTLNDKIEIPVSKRFLELLRAQGLEPR